MSKRYIIGLTEGELRAIRLALDYCYNQPSDLQDYGGTAPQRALEKIDNARAMTQKQWQKVLHGCGNSLTDPEVAAAIFGSQRDAIVCEDALEKVSSIFHRTTKSKNED